MTFPLCLHATIHASTLQVALEEAELQLTMTTANFVVNIAIDPVSLPDEATPAGTSFPVVVKLQTDDSQPLPFEIGSKNLVLKMTPPNSSKDDIISLHPTAACEASNKGNDNGWCAFSFESGDLNTAGTYTLTAEHTEQRADLLKALSKKEATMRSAAISFEVLPGLLSQLHLLADAAAERVTASNGECDKDRQLLSSSALQLVDAFGNAIHASGVTVTVALQWPEDSEAEATGGRLPDLEASGGKLNKTTDRHGKVDFGSLYIKQGTGKASNNENRPENTQGCAMACMLVIEAQAAVDQTEE